ncbi:MAG: hypothetical protein HGA45_42955 [Chloroflexales bacterium]|nr:hypothetical protein [Chloroflexales bacterium]
MVQTFTADGQPVAAGEGEIEEIKRQLKVLSDTSIALYGADLREKELEFVMAALGENIMFQRIFYHAQRAALQFALSQVEGKLTGVWR